MLLLFKNRKREKKPDPIPIEREPLICITFDDGNQSDVDIAYPYLKSKGLVGSFMVVTDWVANPNADHTNVAPRRLDQWEHYKQAMADGFDVQCHTHTHRHLTSLTSAEIHQEMQLVDQTFIDQGLEPPRHHTFPFTAYNQEAIDIILEYRKTVMRIYSAPMSYDHPYVDRYPKPNLTEINSLGRLELNKRLVDDAIENKEIIITTQHGIYGDGWTYGSSEVLWKEWVDYVAESGIRSVTISELYQIMKDYKNQQ